MDVTARFYSMADLARMADVPHPTLSRHLREGRFGPPTVLVGRRMIYDQEGADTVLTYYRAWRPWVRDNLDAITMHSAGEATGGHERNR